MSDNHLLTNDTTPLNVGVLMVRAPNRTWQLTPKRKAMYVRNIFALIALCELHKENEMDVRQQEAYMARKYAQLVKLFEENDYTFTIDGVEVSDFQGWKEDLVKKQRGPNGSDIYPSGSGNHLYWRLLHQDHWHCIDPYGT